MPAVQNLIGLLLACRHKKDLHHAQRLLSYIRHHRLESHPVLGNYLVPTLVDCGCLPAAHQVFDRLCNRNPHSWTSLIAAYVDCGDLHQAFHLYHKICDDCALPSKHTFLSLLKACVRLKDAERDRGLHTDIVMNGLERDLFIGNSLVDVYSKRGALVEARQVFDQLPNRDAVSWNALIAGYADNGLSKEALTCFELMQLEGWAPDHIALNCSLKACGSIGDMDRGQQLCAEATQKGLERNLFIGSTLVDMYGKHGFLVEAHQVFDKLQFRDTVAWNALIAGYAEHGHSEEALTCFEDMQQEGVPPDDVTLAYSMKACGSVGDIHKGHLLCAEIAKRGLESYLCVASTIVDMYAECDLLAEAHVLFSKLPVRDAVLWNAMTAAYAEHGLGEEALGCFKQMQLDDVSPADYTFLYVLKACTLLGDLETGQRIHAMVTKRGLEKDLYIGSSLVDMYGKCGSLTEAEKAFNQLEVQGAFSWNALISGCAEHGLGEEGLKFFGKMLQTGGPPSEVTFICSLKACSSTVNLEKGQLLCSEIVKRGLEKDVFICSTMVDTYAKCGSLAEAHQLVSKICNKAAASWNALIAGYAEHGLGEEALNCFKQMQLEGLSPVAVTYACTLKACGILGALDMGHKIHTGLTQRGLDKDRFVGNTLLDMYAKCGSLAEGRDIFDKLSVRDTVTWNALIGGYADHGLGEESLNCFEQMQLENIFPVAVTYACGLKACGLLGALETGHEIHTESAMRGFERDLLVGNTLVDMYSKCGSLVESRDIFDQLPLQDVVSWNSLIKGYGENHEAHKAVQCFEDMQEQGVRPDTITFMCLLAACSHASFVLKGQHFFTLMKEEYGIEPTMDHYACMVDIHARSGQIGEAEKIAVEAMQHLPSEGILTTLLSACKIHGEVEVALRCFEQLVQRNQEEAAAYSQMADVYVSAGMWSEAKRIEERRKHARAQKKPATVTIEVSKKLHKFLVGATKTKDLTAMLETLTFCIRYEGQVPNLDVVLTQRTDEEDVLFSEFEFQGDILN